MKISYGPGKEIDLQVGNLVKFIPVSGGVYIGVFIGTSKGEWPHDIEKMSLLVDGILKDIPCNMVFMMRVLNETRRSNTIL
jgi:hypothetical protein